MYALKKAAPRLMPTVCLLCSAQIPEGGILCHDCYLDLPVNQSACTFCGAPVFDNRSCGACIRRPPWLDHTITPYHYSYPVDSLIRKFKYSQKLMAVTPLMSLLLERIKTKAGPQPDALLPVPLHRTRLYLRGYNQSQEICRVINRHLGIPIDGKSVFRLRPTTEQTRLTAAQRRKNVRGAFGIRPGLIYDSVAIVDDVVTTAATANEVAKVLKQAGVKRVELWALARAGMGN